MIIEGLVTTLDQDDAVRITALGPRIEPGWRSLVLRPFKTSRTLVNLTRMRQCVFHVTDDVELIARAAIDRIDVMPIVRPAGAIRGMVLADACRWYELQVVSIDDREERVSISCQVVAHGVQREFCGFCRAKHAIVEAAILATRRHLLDLDQIRAEFNKLQPLVDKTGGAAEQTAFDLLRGFVGGRKGSRTL